MDLSTRRTPLVIVALAFLVFAGRPSRLPAAPAPSLQVFFVADFNDQVYQKKVYAKVAGFWKMPTRMPAVGNKAVVKIEILRDGKCSEPTLQHKSGTRAWDDAALEALRRAAPFEPLPKSFSRDSVEVHFHFIYSE